MPVAASRNNKKKKDRGGSRWARIRWLRIVILLILVGAVIGVGAGVGFIMGALETLPAIEDFKPRPALTSFIYDKNGDLLTELHGPENRVLVTLDQVPEHVQEAFIAIEDARFYSHMGLDIWRILGAFYSNWTTGTLQGASTITQQLARTAWLHLDQEWERKIQEAFLAVQLERQFTKREIFQMYLNQINLGHGAHGIQAAARIYFDKDVEDLTLVEGAMLAAIPKGPSLYSAYNNPEITMNRRNLVLTEMAAREMISEAEAAHAMAQPLGVVPQKPSSDYEASYFVDYVVHQILEQFTLKYQRQGMPASEARRAAADLLYQGGLRIYTTLDREMQAEAEEALRRHLDTAFPMVEGQDFVQAAAVFLDPHTGHISAMVGGRARDGRMEFNRAWQAHRQPGSAFKPIAVYTPALEVGHTAASVVDDFPIGFRQFDGSVWTAHNYDHAYWGLTTYREAIRRSVNVAAVKVLDTIGISLGIEYAQKLGIESLVTSGPLNDVGYSLALGGITKGVSPLELARAYSPFANGGFRIEAIAVLQVKDQTGELLIDNQPQREVAISRETAYIMTDMLMSVVQDSRSGWNENWGTGWRAAIPGWPVAGKTGTTDDNIDAWWVGYTPEYLGVVWLGYDRENRMTDTFGGHYPALIWRDVMMVAHQDLEPTQFQPPRELVEVNIDIKSGLLPNPYTPAEMVRREIFIRGTEPTDISQAWVPLEVSHEHPDYLYDPSCNLCEPQIKSFLDREMVEPYIREETGVSYLPRDMAYVAPEQYCTVLHDGGDPDYPKDPDDPDDPDDPGDLEPGAPVTLEFTVRGNRFYPVARSAKVGSEITLMVTAEDQDVVFTLPHLRLEQFIPQGHTVQMVFTINRPGDYDVYCKLSDGQPGSRGARLVIR